jgi:hypothetical protein
VFGEMQNYPELIRPYLHSFLWSLCPFIYARLYNLAIVHSDCNSAKNAWDLEELHEAIERGEVALNEPRIHTAQEIEVTRIRLSGQFDRVWELPQTKAAQKANGRKNVESGHLARILKLPQTKAAQRENGRIAGRKAVESGHLARIKSKESLSKGGQVAGRINGRKAVESGQLVSVCSKESCIKGGRVAGRIAAESGQLASVCSKGGLAGGRKGGLIGGRKVVESGQLARSRETAHHVRWHINRQLIKQDCKFCKESQFAQRAA